MGKNYYSTGTKWEPIVGYSRAVRIGNNVYVSGTTATDDYGEIAFKGDVYGQTVQIIKNIEKALNALGAGLSNVVRTRIFITDIEKWQQVGRAHNEFFSKIKPATSMFEVSRLITDDCLVEIEAEAVVE